MRLAAVLTLSLGCGFLVAGVSAWNAHRLHHPVEAEEIRGFLASSDWTKAISAAQERAVPILLHARPPQRTSRDRNQTWMEAAGLQQALAHFVPVQLTLDGSAADRALAETLGIQVAPLFLIVDPGNGKPEIVDALEPVCGPRFERRGLVAELLRSTRGENRLSDLRAQHLASMGPKEGPKEGSKGGPDEALALTLSLRLEAAGLWEEAASVRTSARDASRAAQGALTRYGRLIDAFQSAGVPSPPDQESALEIHLLREDDPMLLFMGWTRAAGQVEASAQAAAAAGGEHLGVPSERWERRLRETTRKAWISCPDELVLPFGAIVVERFARAPADLDSLDRLFMAAVVRTMARTLKKVSDAEKPHGERWIAEARTGLPPR